MERPMYQPDLFIKGRCFVLDNYFLEALIAI
ncbi:MAG: hypothetical protein RL025_1407 [Bacteroidota bacterium]